MAADAMADDEPKIVSHATHCWIKKVATEEMTCWGSKATINKDDTYYEYQLEIKLYGTTFDFDSPVVTEKEYFKHALQGRPGFEYYDKK